MISVWRLLLLPMVMALLLAPVAASAGAEGEATIKLELQLDGSVVHCDAQFAGQQAALRKALEEGMALHAIWHIDLERLRQYWLNESVATIRVARHVEPDLLSRSWLLRDEATGITLRSDNIDNAISFLTMLDHVAVVDRSLLQAGEMYRATARIEIDIGEMDEGWWAALWRRDQASAEQSFSLP